MRRRLTVCCAFAAATHAAALIAPLAHVAIDGAPLAPSMCRRVCSASSSGGAMSTSSQACVSDLSVSRGRSGWLHDPLTCPVCVVAATGGLSAVLVSVAACLQSLERLSEPLVEERGRASSSFASTWPLPRGPPALS